MDCVVSSKINDKEEEWCNEHDDYNRCPKTLIFVRGCPITINVIALFLWHAVIFAFWASVDKFSA